ncbi:hypothetical protein Tco_1393727 [Tanacetum coccineum]
MTGQDVEALLARAEAKEQKAETLQILLGAAQMNITDLLKSRDHGGISSKQKKRRRVIKAPTARPRNKKGYAGTLPLCNKCKFHHIGPCTAKCGNCERVGHLTMDYRNPAIVTTQRPPVAN